MQKDVKIKEIKKFIHEILTTEKREQQIIVNMKKLSCVVVIFAWYISQSSSSVNKYFLKFVATSIFALVMQLLIDFDKKYISSYKTNKPSRSCMSSQGTYKNSYAEYR
jgi:hypothetical protein